LRQQVEPIVLSPIYQELQKIAKSKSPKMRKNALLGLEFAEKCRVVEVELKDKESHDDLLLRIAIEWKCPIATNDRELRKKLRSAGIPVIFLRQKSRLEVDGNV